MMKNERAIDFKTNIVCVSSVRARLHDDRDDTRLGSRATNKMRVESESSYVSARARGREWPLERSIWCPTTTTTAVSGQTLRDQLYR